MIGDVITLFTLTSLKLTLFTLQTKSRSRLAGALTGLGPAKTLKDLNDKLSLVEKTEAFFPTPQGLYFHLHTALHKEQESSIDALVAKLALEDD